MSFHCKATDHISHISGPHRNVYINTEISEIRVINLKRVIRIRTLHDLYMAAEWTLTADRRTV